METLKGLEIPSFQRHQTIKTADFEQDLHRIVETINEETIGYVSTYVVTFEL